MRGQITFDLLIAIALVTITVAGMVSISTSETANARTLDTSAKLKVLAVDVRDTVTKVYAVGDGFSVIKEIPLKLKNGDILTITLNSTTDRVEITARIGTRTYRVAQKLQVPLRSTTSVTLGPGERSFTVKAENRGGVLYVEIEK